MTRNNPPQTQMLAALKSISLAARRPRRAPLPPLLADIVGAPPAVVAAADLPARLRERYRRVFCPPRPGPGPAGDEDGGYEEWVDGLREGLERARRLDPWQARTLRAVAAWLTGRPDGGDGSGLSYFSHCLSLSFSTGIVSAIFSLSFSDYMSL
jgi:hypothetical protein